MKDPIVQKLVKEETKRQAETLDLIPSENIASHEVLHALVLFSRTSTRKDIPARGITAETNMSMS